MKYIFSIFFTLTLLSFSVNKTHAQSTEATIQADANLITDVSVDATQEIDFGIIIQDSKKTIDPLDNSASDDGGNVTGLIGSENRGYFTLDGTGGTNVDLQLVTPGSLEDPGGNSLDVIFGSQSTNVLQAIVTDTEPTESESVSAISNGDGISGNDFSCQEDFITKNLTCLTTNSIQLPQDTGIVYVVVGGEVTASDTQNVATYSGDITLTATIVN